MPQPKFSAVLDKYIPGKCFPGRFDPASGVQGAPKFIVLHIQEGTNEGTLQHFMSPGVEASSTVLIGKDGEVWRVIHEQDGPWTNGDVKEPTRRARNGILALGGNPNVWSLTIETEGFTGDVPPPAQLEAIQWQIRDWQSRYDIPVEHIIRHADINNVSRSFCPGDTLFTKVMAGIPPNLCCGADPVPPPPFDGTDKRINNVIFHADERTVKVAVDELNCRRFALVASPTTRPPFTRGEQFRVLYWVEGQEVGGEKRWWVTPQGHRVWSGGTSEKPSPA